MEKTVSIIIPFYNREKALLDRCVNSILGQTYPDYECLIIDDGSNEEYKTFLESYKELDTRIKVYHKENGGAGSARNYGVSMARGEYIYFLDSDDYISPYTLDIGVRLAIEEEADMIVGGLRHVEADEDPGFQQKESRTVLVEKREEKVALIMHFSGIKQTSFNMRIGSTGTSPCSRIVKRLIAETVQFENDRYWDEDDLWNMSLVNKCNRIVVADVCWYAYVINPISMVRSYTGDRTEEFVTRAKQEYQRIKELWPECLQGAYYHIWDGLLRYCRTDSFHVDNIKTEKQKYLDFCDAIDFPEFWETIEHIDFNFERRVKYRIVKKLIRSLLKVENKKTAYILIRECIRRVKF